MVADMAYDGQHKRIYFVGSEFFDAFHETDTNHYGRRAHLPTSSRAKAGVLAFPLQKFYLALPCREKQVAELRVYEVLPGGLNGPTAIAIYLPLDLARC